VEKSTLTFALRRRYFSRLICSFHLEHKDSYGEANLSPAQPEACQPARVPCPDGRPLGARGSIPATQEGQEAADHPPSFEARGKLTPGERLPRARRLTRTSELRRVTTTGRRRRMAHIDVLWTDNEAGHPRMGIIVPRFQSTAVARNLLRRRLKEAWRRGVQQGLPGLDVVVRARREAYQARFTELRDELASWRAGVS
jgi:ribonuclease P protein component